MPGIEVSDFSSNSLIRNSFLFMVLLTVSPLTLSVRAQFVESRLSKVELGGVKRGKSHQSITAAQGAIKK